MKNEETKLNKNEIYKTSETIETAPNDGFVSEKVIRPVGRDTIGNYHKGYTKTIVYVTNDPRIIRPFAYGVCTLFFIIGILMLLLHNLFFGIVFLFFAIVCFVKSKKNIDNIARELKRKGQDVTVDSEEEKNQIKKEVVGMFENGLKHAIANTLTKDKVNWFVKITVPICCIIATVVGLLLGILVNIFLGILVFIIFVICTLFYYFILFKKCKY